MSDAEQAREFATEILDSFATLHPAVVMSWHEWNDLREMIERQRMGMGASDLVGDPLYMGHRRHV